MRNNCFKTIALFLTILYCLLGSVALAASLSPALQKAKQEAEAKGYVFLTSHDEIVNMAKREGKMNAATGLEPETIRALQEGFKAEYPFLDVSIINVSGAEGNERLLLELTAGRDTGTDSQKLPTDSFANFLPFMGKYDVLGMAENGVLNIVPKFADPVNRSIIAIASPTSIVAYNKKLISADKIPDTWEGFLKSEFKGKKFLLCIRPTEIAALVPAWGLEKTLDFARKLAAQQPIWIRTAVTALTTMAVGEYALLPGPNLATTMLVQAKDPTGNLAYKFVEPVQVRISETWGIFKNAKNPHAALLFFEFVTGPKGQKIIDQYEPVSASIFSPYSYITGVTKGKKISLVGWDHHAKMAEYQKQIVEAYGFPKAEIK